ncbi:MAG: glycerophosphodiester phosphodiesterase family protein [Elusimicrobiota bacterium]
MAFSFFKTDQKPFLIAHRGASGYAPENTLAAFKLALDMGARFIELDVHQTKDGQVVVIHDDNLKRFGGVNKKINNLTLEEISKVSVKEPFDRGYPRERVPTLDQVLTLVARRAVVNVEIKASSEAYPAIEEKVLSLLERKGYNGMSYISSFDFKCLVQVRALCAEMYLGYLLGLTSLKTAMKQMRDIRCDALVVSAAQASRSLIQRAHQRGFHVLVYTVNARATWDGLAARRVDAIFTDYPDLLGMPEYEEPTLGLTNGE